MDVFNAFKGIEENIGQAIDATMPRQAIATRADSNGGVWVRFTPVDASVPEMWFPSTVADLPAGTAGWVHPLAGGKGRFIADAVFRPVTRNAVAPLRNGIATAGNYTIPATPTTADSLIVFDGLVAGKTYRLAWSCTFSAWSSGTTNGRWAVRVVDNGGTRWIGYNGHVPIVVAQSAYQWNYSTTATASSSGEITICPAVQWNAGQINVSWATISATVSEE